MPEQPLRWRANVLFRHPPHVPAAERAAPGAARDGLGELRSPRTPSPPAPLPRCGRGVVRERGIVDSRRIAAATLIPPSAPALREALTPSPSPALRERGDLVREIAPASLIPPFSPCG